LDEVQEFRVFSNRLDSVYIPAAGAARRTPRAVAC